MNIKCHRSEDVEDLDRRIRSEKNAKQRDRLRAVRLALDGFTCPQIQDKLGRSKQFVQTWCYAYRDHGLEGIKPVKQTGRPSLLTAQQEADLKKRLDAGARPEDQVCTLRAADVARILQKEFGVAYRFKSVYDLLHRLGYSSLRPRPRHPKNDPAAMEAFKTSAPLLSRTSENKSPAKQWKSGSRMKRESASKEP